MACSHRTRCPPTDVLLVARASRVDRPSVIKRISVKTLASLNLAPAAFALSILAYGCGDDTTGSRDTDAADTDTPGSTSMGMATDDPSGTESTTGTGTNGTDVLDGTDTDDSDGPAGVEAARMLLEPLVAAQCENTFSCCNGDEVAYQLGSAVVDAADCTERTLDVLEAGGNPPYLQTGSLYLGNLLGLFAYGVDASVVQVDDDAIATCVAALSAKPCAPSSASGESCTPPEVSYLDECDFRKMFIGQLSEGESCTSYNGLECAPGLLCDYFGSSGGVCVQTLSQGDNCFEDYNCESELICDYASGQCTTPAEAGEACAYANPENPQFGTETTRCRAGLVCNPLTQMCGAADCNFGDYCGDDDAGCPEGMSCVANTCNLLGEAGDQCYDDDDCAQGHCNYLGDSSVCQDLIANGGGCGDHSDCDSGFCDPAQAECAAQTAIGSACDPGLPDNQCDEGYCDGTDCAAFADVGEDCTAIPCNYFNNEQCWDGMCQPYPLPNGQTCSSPFECESQICEGTCQALPDTGEDCLPGGCGPDAYCDDFTDGVCQPRKSWGAPCAGNTECWGSCNAYFGELRCTGQAPGEALCDGV